MKNELQSLCLKQQPTLSLGNSDMFLLRYFKTLLNFFNLIMYWIFGLIRSHLKCFTYSKGWVWLWSECIFFFLIVVLLNFINFFDMFLSVFYCTVKKIGFEKVCLKLKKIIYKFYTLFNDIQNVTNNFY